MQNRILLLLLLLFLTNSQETIGTVYFEDDNYIFKSGTLDFSGVSFVTFSNLYMQEGYDRLFINTTQNFKKYSNNVIAFSAGFGEGYATYKQIWNYYSNVSPFFPNGSITPKSKLFMKKHEDWVLEEAKKGSIIMVQVALIFEQLKGIVSGYNSAVELHGNEEQKLTYDELVIIFIQGDLMDLPSSNSIQGHYKNLLKDHCTAVITLDPTTHDIFLAHTTFSIYPWMNRMMKHYKFNFDFDYIHGNDVIFSSYPGMPVSMDDFYVVFNEKKKISLAVTETTLSCYNDSLKDLIHPESLLFFERTMIANRLSKTALEWSKFFSMYNSGTYNNEWIIVDMEEAYGNEDFNELKENSVVLLDQIPGTIDIIDITKEFVEMKYFPSYNVPYSKKVYSLCKIKEEIEKNPEEVHVLDYDNCVRAQIFKRDHIKVKSMEDMKLLIRYNDYKNDPLQLNDPSWAISARYDLANPPKCGGAVDGKIISMNAFMKNKEIEVINGPTTVNQPVFDYSKTQACNIPIFKHIGQPTQFNFPWIKLNY